MDGILFLCLWPAGVVDDAMHNVERDAGEGREMLRINIPRVDESKLCFIQTQDLI